VDAPNKTVKLDHEDIPGLMKAMVMEFRVDNPKVLEGLKPGDNVHGKLKVESGQYIVTHLEKLADSSKGPEQKGTTALSEKEAKIQGALAGLNPPEDRRLAEAQKFCAVQNSNRLGSMGTPVKLTLEGQPVFLCCDGCKEAAKADSKKALAKAEQLKKANANTK
jgi:hypothetical protein